MVENLISTDLNILLCIGTNICTDHLSENVYIKIMACGTFSICSLSIWYGTICFHFSLQKKVICYLTHFVWSFYILSSKCSGLWLMLCPDINPLGKVRINSGSKICNSWLQIILGLYKNLYTVPSVSSTLVDQNSFFLSYLMKTQAEETKVMEIEISYLHEFIINHTLIFLIHSVPGT